jgi:PEGA domain
MFRTKAVTAIVLSLLLGAVAYAKDETTVIVWPEQGKPVLRFTFSKLREGTAYQHERHYTCDTAAENLWDKRISAATFSVYLFDKSNVRIGEGYVRVNDMGPGEVIKFQTMLHATGVPVVLKVAPESLPVELRPPAPPRPARTISVTINSAPQGATFKLDGEEAGVTPKIVRVTAGKHTLEFNKEGFTPGKFPFEIGPDDASGGSVSYELGVLAHDTVELRDGSVLVCDVESMSATEVVMRVDGAIQKVDRNHIKRMLLVERDPPPPRR